MLAKYWPIAVALVALAAVGLLIVKQRKRAAELAAFNPVGDEPPGERKVDGAGNAYYEVPVAGWGSFLWYPAFSRMYSRRSQADEATNHGFFSSWADAWAWFVSRQAPPDAGIPQYVRDYLAR